jgi:hypothetical protein
MFFIIELEYPVMGIIVGYEAQSILFFSMEH